MPLEIFLNLEEYLLELITTVEEQIVCDLKNEFHINNLLFHQLNTTNWEQFLQSLQSLNLLISPVQKEIWKEHFSIYCINKKSLQHDFEKTQKIIEILIFNTYNITVQEIKMLEKNNSLKFSHK